eukprot:438109_1
MSPFLLSFVIGLITIQAQQNMKQYLFHENEQGGQCLDGSPAGFYYSPPPQGSSNLWVINLEGGGACHTQHSCMSRANSSLGSSNYWSKTHRASPPSLSDDPSINPDFYTGHHVYAPYCNGDVWGGQRLTPSTNPDTWGFYFSGHLVFEHIIQYLAYNISTGSLLDAQYILLTGGSAGGMGTFGNIDWLCTEMKKIGKYKDNITVKAAPIAGWFFPGNVTDEPLDPMMPPNDYPHWVANENGGEGHNDSIVVLYDGYLLPNCVQALGKENAWHCGSVHNAYPYIEAPIFVLENKYDQNQIYAQMLMPKNPVTNETIGYVEYYGINMDRSIITQLIDEKNDKNGLFYPSCFDHGTGLSIGGTGGTIINGYNSSQLVGDWFWERNKLPHIVYDTCNSVENQLPCNPAQNS